MQITYYEFAYRKSLSHVTRLRAVLNLSDVPAFIRPYARKRIVEVPEAVYMTKGFDLFHFLNGTQHYDQVLPIS